MPGVPLLTSETHAVMAQALQDGATQAVTLNFEKAGALTVAMPVSVTPLAKDISMAGMKM